MNRHDRRAKASVDKRNVRRAKKAEVHAAKQGSLPIFINFDESHPNETRAWLVLGDKIIAGTEEIIPGRMTDQEKRDFFQAMAAFIQQNGGRLLLDDGSTVVAHTVKAMASGRAEPTATP